MINGTVSNWMTKEVITVTPETSLYDARRLINARKIRTLPVMKGDSIVGIVTRRGLLRADLSPLDEKAYMLDGRVNRGTVGEIMTKSVLTTFPETLIPKVARVMQENKIAGMPVVDHKRNLVGIITTSDMYRFILEELPLLKEDILVKDYMVREVVTITPDTALIEAHRLMGVNRIRALPVMQNEKLVGIVTRTDVMNADPSCTNKDLQHAVAWQIESQKIEKIMTAPVMTIAPGAPITDAVKMLLENKIHALPVLNAEGELVGIITETDLLTMIVRKFF